MRRRILVASGSAALQRRAPRGSSTRGDARPTTRSLAALAVADAADVLDALPDGLDGEVEERGRSFSGGQRQRLALARALLADPEVLVLVEPTSAVDAHTEARIAERLRALARGPDDGGRHREPAACSTAPTGVVLVDGRVVAAADAPRAARQTSPTLPRRP